MFIMGGSCTHKTVGRCPVKCRPCGEAGVCHDVTFYFTLHEKVLQKVCRYEVSYGLVDLVLEHLDYGTKP